MNKQSAEQLWSLDQEAEQILDDRCPPDSELTVILPVRLAQDRLDALERLAKHPTNDSDVPPEVHFMVVDDGSPAAAASRTRRMCGELGFSYVRLSTENHVFSIGRCRNTGAIHSKADLILFQDVDLIPTNGSIAASWPRRGRRA